MKAIFLIGLILALAGCDKGGTKGLEERLARAEEKIATLEGQGKPNWILTRRVSTKGQLAGSMSPPPVSAFNSKLFCLTAAASMVDSDAVQISVEPPEFESPTKTFKFTCLPSVMQSNTR
jgi:hypothetical protein